MLSGLRHLDAAWWEKFLLAPHNVHYHVDHHLYPSVPPSFPALPLTAISHFISMLSDRFDDPSTEIP